MTTTQNESVVAEDMQASRGGENGGGTAFFRWISGAMLAVIVASIPVGAISIRETTADLREEDRRIEGKIDRVDEKVQVHIVTPGHAVSVSKIDAIEKRIDRIDTTTQEILKELRSK